MIKTCFILFLAIYIKTLTNCDNNSPGSLLDQCSFPPLLDYNKLILIRHYIYKITTNKMNHITHDLTHVMELFFSNCCKEFNKIVLNSHLYLNHKLYFIHTYNITIVRIVNLLPLKRNLKRKVHSQPYKNIQHKTHILTLW